MVIAANHQHHPLLPQTLHSKEHKPLSTPSPPPPATTTTTEEEEEEKFINIITTTPTPTTEEDEEKLINVITTAAATTTTEEDEEKLIDIITTSTATEEEAAEQEKLINTITNLYTAISALPSLHPSPQTNALFSSLVSACIPTRPSLTLASLPPPTLAMRSRLISLCSAAESLLELHHSSLLLPLSLSSSSLLPHLPLFPYFPNYLSLSLLESSLLSPHLPPLPPPLIAFLGSGPLPLSSIILASRHFPSSSFHNYDIDPSATATASALVANDSSLSGRMEFLTGDASAIGERLGGYGVVFLAALVGVEREEKGRVVRHLARHMRTGAMLVVRSAHGARMFLYPVVEEGGMEGFEVVAVHHPEDEVINSVIVARRVGGVVVEEV